MKILVVLSILSGLLAGAYFNHPEWTKRWILLIIPAVTVIYVICLGVSRWIVAKRNKGGFVDWH